MVLVGIFGTDCTRIWDCYSVVELALIVKILIRLCLNSVYRNIELCWVFCHCRYMDWN